MESSTGVPNADDLIPEPPTVAGQATQIPFGISDVGGELVSMFSEGLYGDPRDALREYVQNAVDAGSASVELHFTGRDLHIRDQGVGMDFDDLVAARRIGKSSKSATTTNVGFRGIGVYAGFQICDRVLISTRKLNSDRRWTLTFNFAAMRAVLEASRLLLKRSSASDLGPLISEHTTISYQSADPGTASGTTVVLESISKPAYHELSDPDELKAYLRRTLPVDYNKKFPYRTAVDNYLLQRVPDYKTIRVRLIIDDLGIDEDVTREFPSDLVPPAFVEAVWPPDSDNARAVIWACHSARKRLGGDAGLFFRLKGFTIGDGRELRNYFKRPVVFDWYIGEVHIVDAGVLPNIARNDFESNQARRDLFAALKTSIDDLQSRAVKYQGFMRAVEVVDDVANELTNFANSGDDIDPIERYERLGQLEAKLAVQRVPTKGIFFAPDANVEATRNRKKALADDLKQLRSQWRERVDGRAPEVVQQDPKEKRSPVDLYHNEVREHELPTDESPAGAHWLEAAFVERGWKLTAQTREAIAIIAQALTDADLTTTRWRSKFGELLHAILSRGA